MNIFAPISSLMTGQKQLVTINPEDSLMHVKEIFATHNFHHIPVVRFHEIVGIISRSDFDHYLGGINLHQSDRLLRENHLNREKAESIMTTRMGKVESTDRINVALEIFNLNRFHALPVVDNGELVGIITTYDILKALSAELPKDPTSVYDKQDTL